MKTRLNKQTQVSDPDEQRIARAFRYTYVILALCMVALAALCFSVNPASRTTPQKGGAPAQTRN